MLFEVALPIAEVERIERLEHRATTHLAQNPVPHVLVAGVVNRVAELVSAKGLPGRFHLEQKLAFNGRDAECVGQVDRVIRLALVFRQAAKQLDEGLQKQREGRQPLLAVDDVVQLVRMVIDQPELLVILLNVGGRNLLQSQYAGIVGATVGQIDEILPEGVQLLASPGVTALVVGNAEQLLLEEAIEWFGFVHRNTR